MSGGRTRTTSHKCAIFVCLSSSGLSCWDQPWRAHPLLLPLSTFPLLPDVTPGCGSEKRWSRVELSPAEWPKAAAELSLNAGAVEQRCSTTQMISLPGFCQSLFSIGSGMGTASCGECPSFCLSPTGHTELSLSGQHLLFIKHAPLFLYAFVINIAAVTVHFLLHYWSLSVNGYLNP